MKSRRAYRGSGVPLGLTRAYPRGRAPQRSGLRTVECMIGMPVEVEVLPSRAEERGNWGLQCGM
jgi:hypothetical protein